MRYDDERYLDDEDENDLWDDELELSSDDVRPGPSETAPYPDTPDSPYTTYDPDYVDSADNDDSTENVETDYYSDPEPKRGARSRRERFFRKNAEEEEEDNDYFDSDADPTPALKKPREPKLDPEDPDYWISEEESPLSGIMPGPGNKWKWHLAAAIAVIIAILSAWLWFFRPYSDNAVKYGYIKNMERRGSIIKTFEGSMIPYKELGDPDPFYFQELRFSVGSDSLAALMKRMMLKCVPVRVEYETYHTPLPWKGEQKIIIVKADSADPRKILPPEYRNKY